MERPLPPADDPSLPHAVTLDPGSLDAPGAAPDAVASLAAAEGFRARYEGVRALGRGGMGEVRLVRDRRVGREVALKRQLDGALASAASTARFVREARVQGQLEHPSVVPVYDLGVTPEGDVFFTMMRVRGMGLDAVIASLRRGDAEAAARFTRRRLLADFARLCLAVDYAHARGVVHRDLKPQNVMLGDFGEVLLLDWGLALVQGAPDPRDDAPAAGAAPAEESPEPPVSSDSARYTAAGAVLGTPGYMAPEQIDGRHDALDARTDVYALGVILYELLTLQPLFPGDTAMGRIFASIGVDGASPAKTHPEREVAPELDAACARATARDPEQRFPTARALGEAIERYLDGDRDAARRRQLAAEHAARARALMDSLPAKSGVDAEEARAEAMREATRALALDPRDAEATAVLAAALLDGAATMPAAARDEMERERLPLRRGAARAVTLRSAMTLVLWGLAATMGVRHVGVMLTAAAGLVAASAAVAWWSRARDGAPGHPAPWVAVGASAVALTGLGAVFGPVVVVPSLAMANALLFGALVDFRRPRAIVACSAGPVLLAAALQAAGWLPGGVEVRADAIVVRAGATGYEPAVVWPVMLIAAVATVALPVALLGAIRRRSDALEERLFMHSWHLRNLLPRAEGGRG